MLTENGVVTRAAAEKSLYAYQAMCKRVVDGDTLDLDIDLGLKTHVTDRVRLYGLNAPETYGVAKDSDEYKRGLVCKERLTQLVLGKPLWIETHKDSTEKYGRYLATIWVDGENGLISVNDTLVKEGLAEARSY